MPDMQGILSNDEINQVISRLQQLDRARGAPMACAVCANTKWTIQPRTLMLNGSTSVAGLLGAGAMQNFVLVTCSSCSNSLLFEASAMGVFPRIETTTNAFARFPGTGLGG